MGVIRIITIHFADGNDVPKDLDLEMAIEDGLVRHGYQGEAKVRQDRNDLSPLSGIEYPC